MKTKILLLICLLISLSVDAQTLEYFKVRDKGDRLIFLEPVESPTNERRNTSTSDHRIETFKYVPTNGDQFSKEVYPFYEKCFGTLSEEDKHFLKPVKYLLLFNKEFEVYNYRVYVPSSLEDKLPLYEELLHQFGNECMKINMSPYVIVSYKDQFTGSNYPFQLFMIMRLQK